MTGGEERSERRDLLWLLAGLLVLYLALSWVRPLAVPDEGRYAEIPREMVESGDVYELTPGTIYLLDQHDEHYLYGGENEDMVVACAFTPPLSGKEVHDENGVYPADLD